MMKNKYQDSRWSSFREEIIELDHCTCVRCGRGRDDDVILQVHHKRYISGKKLWEYPFDLCETLCKGCHAQEHGKIRPDSEWEFTGQDDLGGLYGICDVCNANIRHVFFVQHPDWDPMAVGVNCCDKLTNTTTASEHSRLNDRVDRFLCSTRWRKENGKYLIIQKQYNIKIVPETEGFRIFMNSTKGDSVYTTLDDAKKRVFSFIQSGDADKFFKRRAKSRAVRA